ncbi:nucleoside-diphosphate sugar epimerase/dehydratase [Spirulina major CS-329]|uniref:polysaccharide biosynthesis protein n=1 Tax=Spirulina TaxID=1154 RepID=UPI00232CA859|nr:MULTISPECIES: nucleoside-diphosphate sugar epimerase/dehydratase [Spirulina]MDB9494329.1 nucleoside-diphosphate sugar epimerase/dehydratase [Spirulina subsalsa CS-330]MDB9502319.1 nucleoside-diphosphate sugar epimerase/dehydratase [Spirulina major CS-329]
MGKRVRLPSVYRLAHFGLDGCVAWLMCLVAFWVRFEGQIAPPHVTLAWVLPLMAIPGRLLTQTCFGLYQHVWRLFCLKDFIRLLNAVTFYSLLVLVTTRLILPRLDITQTGIPLGVAVIDWSFCLMGMVVLRYARRRSVQQPFGPQAARHRRTKPVQRVLLIGAGQAGALVVQESRQNVDLALEIVGFVDDDRTKVGRTVEGVKVLGTTAQLVEIAQYHGVAEALITIPSAHPDQIRRILALVNSTPLTLKILPGHAELLRDRSLTPQAREIQIQDILGRAEINLDFGEAFNTQLPSARQQIEQRTVLVTGAGGTIGSEICRQVATLRPHQILLLGRGENSIFTIEQELRRTFPDLTLQPLIADIRHRDRITALLHQWRPEIIFHAAAHKHVPLMQQNPTEALENNAIASADLARLATEVGVKTFVMISTDKAVESSNFMGLSKRLAELLVRSFATTGTTRFLVVRFGNVLGSRGSVVPIFKAQIARGGPVTVTDAAMTRYFMTTPEASQLVIQSLAVGQSGQILVLDMGEPVNIYDLAEQMITLAGFTPGHDIPIAITGLRPGEKLHESLFNTSEQVLTTAHPKIRAASSQFPTLDSSETIYHKLQQATQHPQYSEPELWQLAQQCRLDLEAHLIDQGSQILSSP